jgi:hypothetical protein
MLTECDELKISSRPIFNHLVSDYKSSDSFTKNSYEYKHICFPCLSPTHDMRIKFYENIFSKHPVTNVTNLIMSLLFICETQRKNIFVTFRFATCILKKFLCSCFWGTHLPLHK